MQLVLGIAAGIGVGFLSTCGAYVISKIAK